MSREDDFRKLISEQNAEEKELFWQKLEKRLESEETEEVVDLGDVVAKRRSLSNRNMILISVACFLVVALAIILTVVYWPKPFKRYCAVGDYYEYSSGISVADYSADNSYDMLYFSWYNEAELLEDKQYRLNSTDEVICLNEYLVNEDGNYFKFSVTDDYTEIDVFSDYKTLCNQTLKVKSVNINWGVVSDESYATFTYKGWSYYINIDSSVDAEYMQTLLTDLIK